MFDSPQPASRPSETQSRSPAWWTFVAIAVALLPIMIAASFDFGVTWDEKSRHRYGELIWDFWAGRIDRSAAFPEDGGHLYGGLFDVISVGAERWLPGNRYVIRHVIDAIFGWIGILYCGPLAARLFGVST